MAEAEGVAGVIPEDEGDVVTLILKSRDPIQVTKQKLVKNSSVFTYILVECSQSEHDMTDFTPEIVEKFLALLDDKDAEQVNVTDFRELHKISVVFNVASLIGLCRDWLTSYIKRTGDIDMSYWSTLFFFEECYFIYSKWNTDTLIRTFILEKRFKDNRLFISRYLKENYDQLSIDQLRFLLLLAGSNTRVPLETLVERLGRQDCLNDRTRYHLLNTNLSLCVRHHEHLYHQMSRNLSNMSDNSPENLKLVLKLTTEATKEAFERKTYIETPLLSGRLISNFIEEWSPLYDDCKSFTDIVRFVAENKIGSMDIVAEILARVAYHNTFDREEAAKFVEDMEKISESKNLFKISIDLVDGWATVLQDYSNNEKKSQFINLLKNIKNSERLSSFYDNINLAGKELDMDADLPRPAKTAVKSASRALRLLKKTNPTTKEYLFKHDKFTECKRFDRHGEKCGFIIRRCEDKNHIVKLELLSEDSASYVRKRMIDRVHVHKEMQTENMHWYTVKSGKTEQGQNVKIPVRWGWGWWTDWFDGVVTDWEDTEYLVNYKLRDLIAARC